MRPRRTRPLSSFCTALCITASLGLADRSAHAAMLHTAAHHPEAVRRIAATTTSGGWSAPDCGREPQVPSVETGTVARYNASIDAVTEYDHAARAYNGCVSHAASAEQLAISNQARLRIDAIQQTSSGVQRRIAANFAALSAALRKGPPRQ